MKTIRTVIVDDEPLARKGLRDQLANYPDIDIVGEARDGVDAIAVILAASPDLVFLDVQMPEIDGFQVLGAIVGEAQPAVIFVTAFDTYAIRAFDAHAVDYLLKPVDADRFRTALQRARERLHAREAGDSDAVVAETRRVHAMIGNGMRRADRLLAKMNDRYAVISAAEINWIEAADNYVRLHTGRGSFLMRETISALHERLDPEQFARIHRSAIVNMDAVRELESLYNGDLLVILTTGERLSLGRHYRTAFKARFTARG